MSAIFRVRPRLYPTASRFALVALKTRRISSAATPPTSTLYHGQHDDHYPLNLKPNQDEPPRYGDELSDHEWELRTGAAIDLLTQSLPNFFHTGLVSTVTDTPSPPSELAKLTGLARTRDSLPSETSERTIYSSKIRLSYTPPTALPSPLPRTFHIDGLPLYLASAVFVRHTLSALYTDLSVDLRTVRVNGVSKTQPNGAVPQPDSVHTGFKNRQRSLYVGLAVTGNARVGGSEAQWVVNSTYHFHPANALIHLHTVDSIIPEPHSGVFDLLRSVLDGVGGRVGLGTGGCVSLSPAPIPVDKK